MNGWHQHPCSTDSLICPVQGLKANSLKKDPAQRISALVQSVILLKEALAALPGLAKNARASPVRALESGEHNSQYRYCWHGSL